MEWDPTLGFPGEGPPQAWGPCGTAEPAAPRDRMDALVEYEVCAPIGARPDAPVLSSVGSRCVRVDEATDGQIMLPAIAYGAETRCIQVDELADGRLWLPPPVVAEEAGVGTSLRKRSSPAFGMRAWR